MSTELCAYTGKILTVNLSTKEVGEFNLSDEDRKLFLGGKIIAARIMAELIKDIPGFGKGFDPYSPYNPIIVSSGPLTAMGCPCTSRFNTSTISPLTGYYTSSNCGGTFALNMKRAGYDAIIITGKSEEHIYLKIGEDNKVEFKNADALWGMKTGETQAKLEELEGKGGKFVIGPAGENLVRFACVVSDERAAGRGGVGAVFGSKNLKGLFCLGTKSPEAYDKEKLLEVNKAWTERLKSHPTTGVQLPAMGTAALTAPMHAKNILASNNFRAGKYEFFEDISGEALKEKYLVRNTGCISCPIQCTRVVKIEGRDVKGPEVEIMGLMGGNIRNNNLQEIINWNYEIDELGMDTISCSGTIAFAMELAEKGLWKSGLEFGKTDNVSQIIDDIAHRRGAGNDLAEGSKRLSEKYGGKDFAINSKGMELSAYEPRSAVGQGLGYAVANRGGCHLNAGYMVLMEGLGLSVNQYTKGAKAELTAMFQNLMEAISAGGNCLFTAYAFFPKILLKKPHSIVTRVVNWAATKIGAVVKLLLRIAPALAIQMPCMMLPHPMAISAATGMKYKFGTFLVAGERGYNLERMIDVKLGVSAADDTLPKRLTSELQIMSNPNSKVPLEALKKRYYKTRGWDANGIPKTKTIKKLKLEELVKW